VSFYVAVLKCTCHIFYFVHRNNYLNELKKRTKGLIFKKKTQAHKNKIPHYLLKISFVVSYYEWPIFKFLYHCWDCDRNRISYSCNRICFMAVIVTPLLPPAVSHLGRTAYWQTQTHTAAPCSPRVCFAASYHNYLHSFVGYGLDWTGAGDFAVVETSIRALGSTQPPIQWAWSSPLTSI